MNDTPSENPAPVSLEQLLQRDDVWLGHSQRVTTRATLETGYEQLNERLLNRGWPLASLVEVCQQSMQGEWQLFTPALLKMSGVVVLLNPPAVPFSQAFIQAGIDLDRLIVVAAAEKNDFISSFIECARASFGMVLAWQPNESMTYTELRKCQLAAADGTGMSVMFRPAFAQQQSSPAPLRVHAQMVPTGLEITLFKQKGHLQTKQSKPIILDLPEKWKPALPYHLLNQKAVGLKQDAKPKPLASVMPLQGNPQNLNPLTTLSSQEEADPLDEIVKTFNKRWLQSWSNTQEEQRVKFVNIADNIKKHPDFEEKYKNNPDSHNRELAFEKILKEIMLQRCKDELELYKLFANDPAFKTSWIQSMQRMIDQ